MAVKKKTPTPVIESTKVTRIKANDSVTPKKLVKLANKTEPKKSKTKKNIFAPIFAAGRYFKGAWFELRQVTWPDRKSTWGLTVAVLLFTVFFVVLIVLLDAGFKFLSELILK